MRKKNLFHHVITVVILLIGFVLCRYVFFDVHEMKEFPLLLFALGLAALIISCLSSKKVAPYFISLGYIIGFAFGFIFQITKMDANGVSVNNLWVILGVIYVTSHLFYKRIIVLETYNLMNIIFNQLLI